MKKEIDLKNLRKSIEPKTFNKGKGLDIAISLINEFVDFEKLLPADKQILTQSILILEKVKDTNDINTTPQKSKQLVGIKYVDCPICDCNLREKNYQKHMTRVHPNKKKPIDVKKPRKKLDILDSWVMVSGSYGSGKKR